MPELAPEAKAREQRAWLELIRDHIATRLTCA